MTGWADMHSNSDWLPADALHRGQHLHGIGLL